MKVIITGATGMVGKGLLLECLDDPQITQVLTVGRTTLSLAHPKLKELIKKDFLDYSDVTDELRGYDACYLCMGVSAAGLSEAQYRKLTYDYTISLATSLYNLNPDMVCCYVSGQGTDSSEKGKSTWARIKGKTENDLLSMGFKAAYMFRPGAIIPLKGIKSKTKVYQFIYSYFGLVLKIMKGLFPNSIVNTTQIGLAMINIAIKGYHKEIIDPQDILKLSKI
ncbi:MAG: hypothetical protein ACJAT1_000435 [Marivirga sp.]|jgi:hypothetical protein